MSQQVDKRIINMTHKLVICNIKEMQRALSTYIKMESFEGKPPPRSFRSADNATSIVSMRISE